MTRVLDLKKLNFSCYFHFLENVKDTLSYCTLYCYNIVHTTSTVTRGVGKEFCKLKFCYRTVPQAPYQRSQRSNENIEFSYFFACCISFKISEIFSFGRFVFKLFRDFELLFRRFQIVMKKEEAIGFQQSKGSNRQSLTPHKIKIHRMLLFIVDTASAGN